MKVTPKQNIKKCGEESSFDSNISNAIDVPAPAPLFRCASWPVNKVAEKPNASDLGEYLQPCCANLLLMAELFEADVYAFDYSGYGYSSGKPSEANIYADIRAVYNFVRKSRPEKKIVLIGFSLGTATVSDMAASRPEGLAGVVLVAPFTSALRLLGDSPYKPKTCTLDRFNTYDKVGEITVPLLVCHGTQDETIEVGHGLEIVRRARRAVPPLIVDEANHITIFNGSICRHLLEFGGEIIYYNVESVETVIVKRALVVQQVRVRALT
ncbi:hypothetical protein KIN20_016396 [Parelaphostrongylus tenuis]|uniref:AB hydrolase-1 domain-containing protein n=1 Tax=Parelaphostrongylus tenuis TaxID=148309 RepID=A0AAD5MYH4_PARTN|nr:hypothetical protein KIN20_016396 [Parelaphostrongylus tenuis]